MSDPIDERKAGGPQQGGPPPGGPQPAAPPQGQAPEGRSGLPQVWRNAFIHPRGLYRLMMTEGDGQSDRRIAVFFPAFRE